MEIFELIENGDYHAIREEIESFDLEIVNEEGDTPLHYAVKNEDFETAIKAIYDIFVLTRA